MEGWYYDIESDDLYLKGTKVWYIRLTTFDKTRTLALKPFTMSKQEVYDTFMEWVYSFPDGTYVGFHNGIGYDIWAMWKHFDIVPRVGKFGKDWIEDKEVKFLDSYVLSMYLQPNQPKHSLEYLASGSEDEKVAFRQNLIDLGLLPHNAPKGQEFKQWHESMGTYCDGDVDAGIGVLKRLWAKAKDMYGDKWPHASFRQMQKDYWLYTAQAYTGVLFNQDKAKALIAVVDEAMGKLKAEVDPELPPRPLKSAEETFYKMPAKPWNKNGSFSANMTKWLEKHQATMDDNNVIMAYGITAPLVANEIFPVKLPMEIDDNVELKDWFLANGWMPHEDFWNFKKDPETKKPMRDDKGKFIRTTPKIQHQGQICPNLLKLEGVIPAKVVKYLSYRNRKGVVEGWLSNWRIEFDGRLSAEISGYAPTSRVKHRVVTNVPKADIKVLLGSEMRDLYMVPKGFWYVGTDAAALENRTLSHHTFKYDGGAFARMQTEGDPHCYSEDTQILTPDGWKSFGELRDEDRVAQWDDGQISFVKPTCILWEKYKGSMISVNGSKIDLLVTPNHRVPYYDCRKPELKVMRADKLNNRNSTIRLPCTGTTQEEGLFLEDDEIRLIVAIQADASINEKGIVRFEFSRERKIIRLKEILARLKIEYSVGEGQGTVSSTVRFLIPRRFTEKLMEYLPGKTFSSTLLKLSSRQCEVFTREIQYWDGTMKKNGDVVLDTTDKLSRDMAQSIAVLAGYRTQVSYYPNKEGNYGTCDIHRLYLSFNNLESKGVATLKVPIKTVKYNGMIGCVSVPSSFVVVKRNGRVIVSGNTFNAFAFFPEIASKFDIATPDLKEDKDFKPYRNKAKTGAYLLAFGGGAPKLASSLGLTPARGKVAFNNYWEKNKGLGELKKSVESYFTTMGSKYIPAIDGRLVSVRGKNVLLSCLGQGTGAIAMSYAACFMDTWLGDLRLDDLGRPYYMYKDKVVKRISMVHDEYSWEVEDSLEEEIRQMSQKAIVSAGEALKLALPLAAEGKMVFEGSWRDVH